MHLSAVTSPMLHISVVMASGLFTGMLGSPVLMGLVMLPVISAAPCPVCYGNLASCNYASTSKCITETEVASNSAVVVAKAGAFQLGTVIAVKFLRAFPRTILDTIINLVNRPAPGTPFALTEATTNNQILNAVSCGQMSMEIA